MNTSQYNYFINNEPNFQTINDWENGNFEDDFFSQKIENAQSLEQNLKSTSALDNESEFLKLYTDL